VRRPPADLLSHLAGDLEGCDLVRTAGDAAIVTPPPGTPSFVLQVVTDRRRLLQLTTTVVVLEGVVPADLAPAGHLDTTDAEVAGEHLLLRHTGQLRRTGIEVVARAGGRFARATATPHDPVLRAIAQRLRDDADLREALLPLDTTRAELRRVGERGWRLELELMGGSHVRTTLPPSQAYVRLAVDQRDALLAVVRAVAASLPVLPHERSRGRTEGVTTSADGAAAHLPPRRRERALGT
jgi:hypothetical protein